MAMPRKLLSALALASAISYPLAPGASALAQAHQHEAVREIEIIVEGGYKPSRIEVHAGERVRLKFVRKEYSSCTREVVFPSLHIRRELPPNQPVVIDLPALQPGEYEFKCGMNMIRGTLLVVP